GANSCCFGNLKTIMLEIMQPVKETSSKLMSSSAQSSPSGNLNLPSSQKNSTIETTLNAFIAQQSTFNNRLMQMINEQNEKFVTQQTLFNNKLTDMMNDQNSKLTEIKNLAKTVADQQSKINKLQMQNSKISKSVAEILKKSENISTEVEGSKCELKEVSYHRSSEIIISGVPTQFSKDPRGVANSVLQKLDIPQLMADVLETRLISPKNTSITALPSGRQPKSSFIVKFKSAPIARHMIQEKRRKGTLTVQQLFDCDIMESWLKPRVSNNLVEIHGYYISRNDPTLNGASKDGSERRPSRISPGGNDTFLSKILFK
ncbi:hypothetical protein PV325_011525, partial [Microctonus aethiopoides]